MAFPAYTYTLTNGTTADATQVMQNFSDILNGISDGTKDISVNNITGATTGTANLSGNTILGTSTSQTIVMNGKISASIPFAANTTYDIGTATLGVRSLYVGGTSTFTTRIMSGATSSWTLTLPVDAGTNGKIPQTDGSGTLSWVWESAIRSVTTTDAATTSDKVLLLSGSSFTETLFTAVGNAGKVITLIHNGTTLTSVYTLATTSSQTIGGVAGGSYALYTTGETLTIISDGANWQILNHKTITAPAPYTPTFSAAFGSPVTLIAFQYSREGKYLFVAGTGTTGTVASSIGSISMPSGTSIDTGVIALGNTTSGPGLAVGNTWIQGGSNSTAITTATGTDGTKVYVGNSPGGVSSPNTPAPNYGGMSASNSSFTITFRVPITGWQA